MLPDERHMDERVEDAALRHGLLVTTTHSNLDGFVGDEVTLAPAFTSTDAELAEMVSRLAATMRELAA
jgi:adenosylmethionine-8-amino-7-oxononanoate aminotransferase